ncbi:MAG: acyl-ACP thioesterase domain-containing protein [Bacteroidota bacterium]
MQVYEKILVVQQDDLDELNHVNNIRYLDWVQQVSRDHWEKVTTPEIRAKLLWVVRKHEINYLKSALLGDVLKIKTQIIAQTGPISKRIVEIRNNKTDALLVKASTEWCLLDATSFKPKRVPREITSLFE